MVSTKGDTRAQRLPKDTCRFGTDLKFADLQSVKSTKWINDFVASSNEHLVVNTDRYIFQMAALATMLSKGPQVRCSLDTFVALCVRFTMAKSSTGHVDCPPWIRSVCSLLSKEASKHLCLSSAVYCILVQHRERWDDCSKQV